MQILILSNSYIFEYSNEWYSISYSDITIKFSFNIILIAIDIALSGNTLENRSGYLQHTNWISVLNRLKVIILIVI